jgi:hypothetical protein
MFLAWDHLSRVCIYHDDLNVVAVAAAAAVVEDEGRHTYVRACVCTCVCRYTHTYVHILARIHARVHIHTSLREREHLEDLSVDGRRRLKLMFEKWDGEAWSGLI